MLGRTAASLFWMSRYVERAENMARLLEVGYRISLMPRAIEGHRDEWRSTLITAASEASYFAKHREITTADIIHHLLFDEDNPSSVRSCLETARNNGRAVRTALTRDVWESLNGTWNEFAQVKPESVTTDRLPGFLDWIEQRAMLFRGALLGTMLRHDTYFFSQLGTFVERADNTARILDVKYYILLPKPSDVGSDVDVQQWATVLRSVSAHRAYRWFYRDVLEPRGLVVPLVISEAGIDGILGNRPGPDGLGWQDFQSFWVAQGWGPDGQTAFLNQLQWVDNEARQDPYVIGYALFTAGGGRAWDSYELDSFLPRLAEYVVSQR